MMSDELQKLIETLGLRDWRKVAEAERAYLAAGPDGMQAVIDGMEHPMPRVRRACAAFMDHHGNEVCVTPLTQRLLSDPVANVRREAVHSLGCQRCKESPLEADVTPPSYRNLPRRFQHQSPPRSVVRPLSTDARRPHFLPPTRCSCQQDRFL